MSDELKPKTVLPANHAVLFCEVRSGGDLWPISRIDLRQDGVAQVTSGRGRIALALAPLEQAYACAVKATTEQAATAAVLAMRKLHASPPEPPAAETVDSPFNPHPNTFP